MIFIILSLQLQFLLQSFLLYVRETVELCRQLERCGVTFITIHGRTPSQKCEPVNEEAFIEVKKSISVPLIVNGDIKHLDDAEKVAVRTNCNGNQLITFIIINITLVHTHIKK